MELYVGMDLHSSNTVVAVIDKDLKTVFMKKFSNRPMEISDALLPFKEHVVGVVIESTFNWYWLADELIEAGFKVHLANPGKMSIYKGKKYTDDKDDAVWLAKSLKLGILPTGYIHDRSHRLLRDLLRKRSMLVRQRTQHILSLRSLLNRNLCQDMTSNRIKQLGDSDIDEIVEETHLRKSAKANIAAISMMNGTIRSIENDVFNSIKNMPFQLDKLMAVPGIGKTLALTIILETGNIDRFKTAGQYASYCRCVPALRLSNEKIKGQNNKKNGNKYLAWAYIEAENCMIRWSKPAKDYYLKKAKKTKRIIALKAIANKLSKACFYIQRDGAPFEEYKLFNNPFKIKAVAVNQKRG